MIITKVGQRGQVTLPKEIRRQMGIKEGDQVAFLLHGDQVLLKPVTQTLLDLRGSVPVSGEQDFEAIRQQVFSKRAKRVTQDEA